MHPSDRGDEAPLVPRYGEKTFKYVYDTLFSLRIRISSDIVEYGSGIGQRKTLKNEFRYIHLVSILKTDTDTDIHITSYSGYEYPIIRISISIFHH